MTSPRSIWTAAPFSNRGNKLCLSDGDAGPRYGTACCHGIQYCVYENTCVEGRRGGGDACAYTRIAPSGRGKSIFRTLLSGFGSENGPRRVLGLESSQGVMYIIGYAEASDRYLSTIFTTKSRQAPFKLDIIVFNSHTA